MHEAFGLNHRLGVPSTPLSKAMAVLKLFDFDLYRFIPLDAEPKCKSLVHLDDWDDQTQFEFLKSQAAQ